MTLPQETCSTRHRQTPRQSRTEQAAGEEHYQRVCRASSGRQQSGQLAAGLPFTTCFSQQGFNSPAAGDPWAGKLISASLQSLFPTTVASFANLPYRGGSVLSTRSTRETPWGMHRRWSRSAGPHGTMGVRKAGAGPGDWKCVGTMEA